MTQFDLLIESIYPQSDSDELAKKLAVWRFKSQKIVFTHGYFDALHKGHIEYLAKAAELGDILVVGIYTDSSASRIKGKRFATIHDEYSRAMVLASLQFVGGVVFIENDPTSTIEIIKPNVLVAGYEPKTLHGYDFVTQNGGSVVTIKTINSENTPGLICSGNEMVS